MVSVRALGRIYHEPSIMRSNHIRPQPTFCPLLHDPIFDTMLCGLLWKRIPKEAPRKNFQRLI